MTVSKVDIIAVLEEKKPLIEKAIGEVIPKDYSLKSIEFFSGKARYEFDQEAIQKGIADPAWDLLSRGGKRWRPALFLIMAEALSSPEKAKKLLHFAGFVEVIHNGSLMVDDIEDDSDLRRGKPCVHKTYGVDLAINAGNAMYFLPFALIPETKKLISDEKRLVVYETVLHEMINLHVGQTMDIVWHKGLCERVSEKQYLQMCAFKTGGLSRMACKLAALFSGAKPPLVEASGRFGEAIGVAFQIQDDVLNLEGDEGAYGKEIGGDVSEGKRTLMVIHALNNLPARDASRLKEILGMHTKDQKLILEAISLIKKSNSLEYAKKEAKVIVKGAWKELEPQVKESKAKEELRAFADYLIERKY